MKKAMLALLGWTCMSMAMPAFAEDKLPESGAQVSRDVAFPSIDRAKRPQGAFVPARNIALVAPGLKKSEVYTLLDLPHFSEGLWGVRRWNYIFNFYTGHATEYRQCQYQIRFDKHYRVESIWWRDRVCADLFEQALAPAPAIALNPAPAPAPVPVVSEERVARTYGFNFDFDKSDIAAEGDRTIDEAVAEASRNKYKRIVVTGFTDTMGATEYNDGLAARRAASTVRALIDRLQKAGNPLANNVFSRGGRDLAVPTAAGVRELRNRRVNIEFY